MSLRTRRPPAGLRILRSLAALSVLGLACIAGYQGLRAAGFRFLWEVDRGSDVLLDRRASWPVGSSSARGGRAPTREPGPSGAEPAGAPGSPGSGPGDPTPAEGPVGRGEFASIDFETFSNGGPVCSPCPVSEEWAGAGLRLSFRSWSAGSRRPHVLDARNFLPEDASTHALGPPFAEARGLEVGVIRLDFPGQPRRVAFTLYGPDLIPEFDVTAASSGASLPSSAVTRTIDRRYRPAGRAEFRAERILVEWAGGIDRISLDGWGPPGHVLLVDDLAIDP